MSIARNYVTLRSYGTYDQYQTGDLVQRGKIRLARLLALDLDHELGVLEGPWDLGKTRFPDDSVYAHPWGRKAYVIDHDPKKEGPKEVVLLSCPFCGLHGWLSITMPSPKTKAVKCDACGAMGPDAHCMTKAKNLWNKRKAPAGGPEITFDEVLRKSAMGVEG